MKTVLYRIYQLFIVLPVFILWTIFIVSSIAIGCIIGDGNFWGYRPGVWWGRFVCKLLFLPVTVTGRENLKEEESYVFLSNHQGAFDIFLIYGYLGRSFRWMMKHQLRQIPFFGYACEKSNQIMVDRRGPKKVKETYDKARRILSGGISLCVFPEGSRTRNGKMREFKRGAFMLADELQLPVVPMTINGSFNVMPRTKDWHWAVWHPLSLTIHTPIYSETQGPENIKMLMEKSRAAINSALVPEYQDAE